MKKLFLIVCLCWFSANSNAALLELDIRAGQLHGAINVDVGGTFYDVEFLDGTCASIFGGCDSASDFVFQSLASATLAAQSILDLLLQDSVLGLFDNDHALTFGCSHSNQCNVDTPYAAESENDYFRIFVVSALNFEDSFGSDRASQADYPNFFDFENNSARVFAKWSLSDNQGNTQGGNDSMSVSEPSQIGLMLLLLLIPLFRSKLVN